MEELDKSEEGKSSKETTHKREGEKETQNIKNLNTNPTAFKVLTDLKILDFNSADDVRYDKCNMRLDITNQKYYESSTLRQTMKAVFANNIEQFSEVQDNEIPVKDDGDHDVLPIKPPDAQTKFSETDNKKSKLGVGKKSNYKPKVAKVTKVKHEIVKKGEAKHPKKRPAVHHWAGPSKRIKRQSTSVIYNRKSYKVESESDDDSSYSSYSS